jgi:hypothetical protein
MRFVAYGLIAFCAAISGCAQDPTRIEPTFVSTTNFATYDCAALAAAIAEREPRLTMLAKEQTNRRNADFAAGIVIGLTPSMFDGKASQEAEIGGLKGELVAIRKSGEEKGCALPPQSAELTAALDPRPMSRRVQ